MGAPAVVPQTFDKDAAAKALAQQHGQSWQDMSEYTRQSYREEAAKSVAPGPQTSISPNQQPDIGELMRGLLRMISAPSIKRYDDQPPQYLPAGVPSIVPRPVAQQQQPWQMPAVLGVRG